MSKNKLPPEDTETWEAFSASIKPIKPRKRAPSPLEGEGRGEGALRAKNTPPLYPLPQGEGKLFSALKIGDKSSVDGRSFDHLRKGEMPIDRKLDLHGKNQAQAFQLLIDFVKKAAADGKRCLLIITGKGRPDAAHTLRESLPDWLNHPDIRPHIITFTQAAPHKGGTGAYTILLKRKRDY